MCKNIFCIEKRKLEKLNLFSREKSKMKKSLTIFYNLPYESFEKKSNYEVEIIISCHHNYHNQEG